MREYKIGDKVKIISNDLYFIARDMVGTEHVIVDIKYVYPSTLKRGTRIYIDFLKSYCIYPYEIELIKTIDKDIKCRKK